MNRTNVSTRFYPNGFRKGSTLLEVLVAAVLVGTLVSMVVVSAGAYQKASKFNQSKRRDLDQIQAFISSWSITEFSEASLPTIASQYAMRVVPPSHLPHLASGEIGITLQRQPGAIEQAEMVQRVSLEFWRGDAASSSRKVTSLELLRTTTGAKP